MQYVSILQRNIQPWKQLVFFICLLLIGQLIAFQLHEPVENLTIDLWSWEVSFTVLLLYSLFNSIISLVAKDQNQYWLMSLICFVTLAVIGGLLATQLSGVKIDDTGQLRWMYLVFTFGYLIILTIARSMRRIVEIAQKQDARLRGEDL